MSLLKQVLHFWKSIAIILVILYLSFAPPSTFKEVPAFEYEDKLIHFLMYLGLTVFLIYDFGKWKKYSTHFTAFVICCVVLPIVLGGKVEIIQQYFFPPRTAEWIDWFSDIAGVFVAWAGMSLLNLAPGLSAIKVEK